LGLDVGLTKNERDELHTLASNVRDDRLRGLVFKLLAATATPSPEDLAALRDGDDAHDAKHSRRR
jgi:hypothetical protein